MKYQHIVEGIFIKRVNRFVAHVYIDHEEHVVHVKNTGRCKELFIEGQIVYLEESFNPARKTKFSLISIYKGDELINIDSQVPNQVIFDGLKNGEIEGFDHLNVLKREQTYGLSRFDMYYETELHKGYIEVKGVTLEENGIARFPDAPTTRGTKHVKELTTGQKNGYHNHIIFLIQIENVNKFIPNELMDPDFTTALRIAELNGVQIHCYTSINTSNTISINKKIAYVL